MTTDILQDVCGRITGRTDYEVSYDNSGYNKGRLATLMHDGCTNYVSFSETSTASRNSSFQSFATALVGYHQEPNLTKALFFYFLPAEGNRETPYFGFMYRLMKTAGAVFLNEDHYLQHAVQPFNCVADIIAQRDVNRERNRVNRSTYVTVDEDSTIQLFGKTFGANKYETTLLCLAIHAIARTRIELYEIAEGGLSILPANARNLVIRLGVNVIISDLTFERDQYNRNDSLRSPTFLYNLLDKLGEKRCSLCACEVPELIQGAHIWPVARIKKATALRKDTKLESAIDRENGLWLCNNHHKLFDMNVLLITADGRVKYRTGMRQIDEDYVHVVTAIRQIPPDVRTTKFLHYLRKRNAALDERAYALVE